ncbi:MAG: heavy-metal-associated domain-containing protein [Flavobacteriaceae bacterium]|nr:heavy-metal-associated domain-containing protein [Flavobacteriaceae bacterium]
MAIITHAVPKKTNLLAVFFMFIFFVQSNLNAQNTNSDDKVYVKIEVNGMACSYCAFGMEKALKKVSGVDNVAIELEEGMAYISAPKSQKPQKENLSLIIQKDGFTPGIIEFSDQPFKKDDTKD